jgi:hypothetical protein
MATTKHFSTHGQIGWKPLGSPIFPSCFSSHGQTLIQKTKSYLPCFGVVKIQIGLNEKIKRWSPNVFSPNPCRKLLGDQHSFHLTPPKGNHMVVAKCFFLG